jgi:hypothetical protein
MKQPGCTTSPDELLAWWLDELDADEEEALDEHLFACPLCARRLNAIVTLGDAIRDATLHGEFGFVVPAAFVARLKRAGLTLREYQLNPGGSVNCTIAPGEDFVVANLTVPLAGVQRLDVLIDDMTFGKARLTDVPFDPATGALTVVPSAAMLRAMQSNQQRLRLVAVEPTGERELGEYTFNHSPS